eukprot:05541_5
MYSWVHHYFRYIVCVCPCVCKGARVNCRCYIHVGARKRSTALPGLIVLGLYLPAQQVRYGSVGLTHGHTRLGLLFFLAAFRLLGRAGTAGS